MKKVLFFIFFIFNILSFAQDARFSTVSFPAKASGFAIYSNYISAGDSYVDSKKVGELDYNSFINSLRGFYYFDIGKYRSTIQVLLPFGTQKTKILGTKIEAQGIGDLILESGIWFVNDSQNKTYLGFAGYLTSPSGNFDKDEILNMGSNRYKIKPELFYGKGFGNNNIDLIGSIDFYTEDKERNIERNPSYNLEVYYSKNITKQFIAGINYYYALAGKVKVNNIKIEDQRSNEGSTHNLRIEGRYSLSLKEEISLRYQKTLKIENGTKMDVISFRYIKVIF